MNGDTKTDAAKLTTGVPELTVPTVGDALAEAERVEKARLARMAGQAREFAGVLPLAAEGAAARARPTAEAAPRSDSAPDPA